MCPLILFGLIGCWVVLNEFWMIVLLYFIGLVVGNFVWVLKLLLVCYLCIIYCVAKFVN